MNIAIKLDLFQYIFPVFEKYNFDATAVFRVQCACLPVHRERNGVLSFSEDVPKSLYINVSSGRRRCSTEKERIFLFGGRSGELSAEKSEHPRHRLHSCPPIRHTPMNAFLAWQTMEFGTHSRTPGEPGVVLTRCFEHENQEIFFPIFFFF